MSKPVKEMITEIYRDKFSGIDGAIIVSIRGIGAIDNGNLRGQLAEKQMKLTVVKNTLARTAFSGTALENISDILEGPSAVVYGGESVVNVAREVIAIAKKMNNLEVKGAILDGTVFQAKEVDRLSKFPTRDEALAQTVTLFLSPARNLAGSIASPGAKIASILKTIEEKHEKGEAITKVA